MTDRPWPLVAAVQLNSQDDVAANLVAVSRQVAAAAARGAELVLLPENFAFMGGTDEQRRSVAEPVDGDGPIVSAVRRLAREHRVSIVAGGMPERTPDPDRPHNTALVVDASGETRAVYRKIHLFDVEVGDGQSYRESAAVTAGTDPQVVELPTSAGPVRVGLSICYDLRFPELYRRLVDLGAQVLVVPAAFTMVTGKDHWHVLLRARAIESQCHVIAAAQWGQHPRGRTTFGKSLVVDPWGDVIAQASEGVGVVVAPLDLDRLVDVRKRLPSLSHRRLLAGRCLLAAGRSRLVGRSQLVFFVTMRGAAPPLAHRAAGVVGRSPPRDPCTRSPRTLRWARSAPASRDRGRACS